VRLVANRAYALCPDILNDARVAPWSVAIHSVEHGYSVELSPRLVPDPRFSYRQKDVPAASHPPLAACMARLGGRVENEIVWDPFCGSGLELIERALLGGVLQLHGTDRSAEAVGIARGNFEAAKIPAVQARFVCCDFREYEGLKENAATLIVTNPPMGKRVPIPNLHGLIMDLFSVAAKVLRPGGRLVFANPVHIENPHRALKLQSRQVIDLGGFDCRLECYRKVEE
jgi:tRNA G10  N-methylase Trm11